MYYDLCGEARTVLRDAAKEICADENLLAEALRIKNKLADLSAEFKHDEEFKGRSAQFGAFVFTLAIEDMEKIFTAKNIPHDILLDTISDLGVWINRHHTWTGEWGFSQYGWLILHLRGKIFKLGRLQFEISDLSGGVTLRSGLELKRGEPFLNIHIPRGGKMDEASCLESFEQAKEFFPRVLSYDCKAFGCYTWLFDPAFEKLLPPDSNILKFQKLFEIFPGHEDYGGLEYVFVNITKENIKDAPTDTYFRKTLAGHILSGGIMQSAPGYREI
jgi:hypothetical protein